MSKETNNQQQQQQQQYQQYYYQNCYPYAYLTPNQNNTATNPAHASWYQQQQQNYYNYYQSYAQYQNHQQQQQHQQYFNQYQYNPNAAYNWQQNQNYHQRAPRFQNHQQNNQQQNKFNNKQKPNKRDLPENNKFFCEACDRGFKTEEKYKEHLGTHRVCGKNGCKFEAADKLVQIHIRNFHSSGLDKKLSRLENEDEIKKYIEERKKNYPTKDNMDKKVEIRKDKAERFEVLTTKEFRKDGRGNKRKRPNRHEKNQRKKFKNNQNNANDNNESVENKTNENESFTDENKENKQTKQFNKPTAKKPTLLERLLAPEIRHERNLLLQCIRYIVNKNFFMDQQLISTEPKND